MASTSTPRPLRSSLRQPQSQPSPLIPYTPVPDIRNPPRSTSRNNSRTTPRAPAAPLANPLSPGSTRAGGTHDPTSPKRRSWLSREPATPRQRISNYYPPRTPSQQPYPPFFPPQGYSPANSPWHTPGGRPLYGVDPNYPVPLQIAPVDSGLGVLSPPNISGPYSRPPRDSAISEEEPSQGGRTPAPAPAGNPSSSPNYLVGSPPIPENLQPATHGEQDMSFDPREGVLGPAGSAASTDDSQPYPGEPPKSGFVGGFVSGLKKAFGRRQKPPVDQYTAMNYPMGYSQQGVNGYPNPQYQPSPQPQQQYNGDGDHPPAPPSSTLDETAEINGPYPHYEPQYPENEPTVVGHVQQAPGTISNDPLPLPVETPFGSPSTIVTPFLLTRPVSEASPWQEGQDMPANQSYTNANTPYTEAPTFTPAVSTYIPPATIYPVDPLSPVFPVQGYTSPPQAADYLKMSPGAVTVPLSSYLMRFKEFLKTINNLPWVAQERVTVDYYPGVRKRGDFGRQERRWTVSWTRKGESERSDGYGHEVKPSGRLHEIDLSSSEGSASVSPVIPVGPNGIQYPQYSYQPFMPPGYYYPDPAVAAQVYYYYTNPADGNLYYPYPSNQYNQAGTGTIAPTMQQYPAGYAPDHRPDHVVWGSPVHRSAGTNVVPHPSPLAQVPAVAP